MLLNDKIQIPFTNTGKTIITAGQAIILGQRATFYRGVIGVAVADVAPGASGLLETSGIFSFDDAGTVQARQFQQVYAYHTVDSSGVNTVVFTLTLQDTYVYAGISLTDRATNGGPLILALGYNNPVYKAPASGSTSNPSGGKADATSDTATPVDPSSTSEPGEM